MESWFGPVVSCCGDVGTCRFIQAEVENIPIRMSLCSLRYGTASFCHKILCGPRPDFYKRKQNALLAFDTEDHYFSAQPFYIIQQVVRTVPDAGRGLCQIGVDHMLLVHCYLGRKGAQQTVLLLKTFWIDFALVLLVVCQTVKLQFRYFHRSGVFTFRGLVQVKGNERKNLNTETDSIKLPVSMAFLAKLTSTCCNLQALWKRPLTSLPRSLQENNMDSMKVLSQRLKETLHGIFTPPSNPNNPDLSLFYTTQTMFIFPLPVPGNVPSLC